MRNLTQALPVVLSALCLTLTGCGSQSTGTTLSGTVTYKGQPVTGGELKLYYPDKHVVPIAIRADGSFSTSGVTPGVAKVTVDTAMFKGAGKAPPRGQPQPPADLSNAPKYVAIPRKYADLNKTPLSWDIKGSSERQEVNLTD